MFLKWKSYYLESLRREAFSYKSIQVSQSFKISSNLPQAEANQMIAIDEGLIQVQSEAALALETRLEKQLSSEQETKIKRIITQLIQIY